VRYKCATELPQLAEVLKVIDLSKEEQIESIVQLILMLPEEEQIAES